MERAKALRVNAGIEPDADLGPVISKQVGTDVLFFFSFFLCNLNCQLLFQESEVGILTLINNA